MERYERFSELLKHCLHFSSRPDVLESLRAIFAHFLEAFDLRVLLSSEAALKVCITNNSKNENGADLIFFFKSVGG